MVEQFTGTLQSGWAGIGGEHTGWALIREADASGILEADVSRCRPAATALNGQRVTITGRLIDKQYVERGTVRILLAERIAPAGP